MLYTQTSPNCLKKLEKQSKILFHTFTLLHFISVSEDFCQKIMPQLEAEICIYIKKIYKDSVHSITQGASTQLLSSSCIFILTKESLSQIHAYQDRNITSRCFTQEKNPQLSNFKVQAAKSNSVKRMSTTDIPLSQQESAFSENSQKQ